MNLCQVSLRSVRCQPAMSGVSQVPPFESGSVGHLVKVLPDRERVIARMKNRSGIILEDFVEQRNEQEIEVAYLGVRVNNEDKGGKG